MLGTSQSLRQHLHSNTLFEGSCLKMAQKSATRLCKVWQSNEFRSCSQRETILAPKCRDKSCEVCLPKQIAFPNSPLVFCCSILMAKIFIYALGILLYWVVGWTLDGTVAACGQQSQKVAQDSWCCQRAQNPLSPEMYKSNLC